MLKRIKPQALLPQTHDIQKMLELEADKTQSAKKLQTNQQYTPKADDSGYARQTHPRNPCKTRFLQNTYNNHQAYFTKTYKTVKSSYYWARVVKQDGRSRSQKILPKHSEEIFYELKISILSIKVHLKSKKEETLDSRFATEVLYQ